MTAISAIESNQGLSLDPNEEVQTADWNERKVDWRPRQNAAFSFPHLPTLPYTSSIIPISGSKLMIIEGHKESGMTIIGINGINNSLEEAKDNALYLQKLASGYEINWVYNQTHSSIVDILEAGILNYSGISPHAAAIEAVQLMEFHQENIDNPYAKALLFCHSQGAIHTKNALKNLPEEVQQRAIVIAISPAEIIPRHLCYKVFNYASSNDFIPQIGRAVRFIKEVNTADLMDVPMNEVFDDTELHILPAAPGTSHPDHNLQSPTFEEVSAFHFKDYFLHKGEYYC